MSSVEELAEFFHKKYEELAPQYGYETRRESAVLWSEVPEKNRRLMIAVCKEVVAIYITPLEENIHDYDGYLDGVHALVIELEKTIERFRAYGKMDSRGVLE